MNLRRAKRSSPIIPIVPLVDILVVMLMFFIATTTFKKKPDAAQHLQINLPQSGALGSSAPQKEVRTTLAITPDKKVFLDGKEVADAVLADELKKLKKDSPGQKLELRADKDTTLEMLLKVWDALKAAGWSINEVPARILRAAEAAGQK